MLSSFALAFLMSSTLFLFQLNELLIGNVDGVFAIFKGDLSSKPWKKCSELGTVRNNGISNKTMHKSRLLRCYRDGNFAFEGVLSVIFRNLSDYTIPWSCSKLKRLLLIIGVCIRVSCNLY